MIGYNQLTDEQVTWANRNVAPQKDAENIMDRVTKEELLRKMEAKSAYT